MRNTISQNLHIKNLLENYKEIAKSYGIFADRVVKTSASGEEKVYLVFGIEPIKNSVNPVEIINRNKRNNNLFYPDFFAVDLYKDNPLLVCERVTQYLAYADLMCTLYEQFNTPLPKCIRCDELNGLANFYRKQNDLSFDYETRAEYAKGLREFFKQENTKSKFQKKWKEFYRSEMFDTNKSFVGNFVNFLKRDEPEVDLDVLLESNTDWRKIYISEHWYKEFKDVIKTQYPNVKYSIGDKKIINEGDIVDPNTGERIKTQYGITVTEEEYDKICEERFSTEGFKCLDDLTPSYFEGRDIYYKTSDENIVASVINTIALKWCKCPLLSVLEERGKIIETNIPCSQMKNFYATMRQYNVPFCLDNDVNHQPNLETIKVLYNACDEHIVTRIITGLTYANFGLAHIDIPLETKFKIDIDKIDELIESAKTNDF